MKRILIIGESPFAPTRFGTIVRQVGEYLKMHGGEIAVLGYGYTGWPFKSPVINYPLYPWIGTLSVPHNIEDVLEEWKPDTLVLIGPPILFTWLKDFPNRKSYRIILHTAFKSHPINRTIRDVYELSDITIVNSNFEEKVILDELPDTHVRYIPFGLDTKSLMKSKSFAQQNSGQFGVACVAKDSPKIDFPSLLKSWGVVAKSIPHAAFGIFSDPAQLMAWNIPDMLEVYGIQQRTFIHTGVENNFGFTSMGDLFASIDMLVLLHQEEILNTTSIEASYCGTPMIVAGKGPTVEYLPDMVIYPKKTDIFIAPPQNTRYTVFDADEIAEIIIAASQLQRKKKKTSQFMQENCVLSNVLKEWLAVLVE